MLKIDLYILSRRNQCQKKLVDPIKSGKDGGQLYQNLQEHTTNFWFSTLSCKLKRRKYISIKILLVWEEDTGCETKEEAWT